jgi:hypothetical protein
MGLSSWSQALLRMSGDKQLSLQQVWSQRRSCVSKHVLQCISTQEASGRSFTCGGSRGNFTCVRIDITVFAACRWV